jgi:uncharacterized heparinase superfamily protein
VTTRRGRGPLATALLYARTAVGLRPAQFVHLVAVRLRGRRSDPAPRISATIDPERFDRFAARLIAAGPGDGVGRIARAERSLAGRLSLLGVERELATLEWGGAPVSPLWTYHLHYLDWAIDLAWAFRSTGRAEFLERLRDLLDRWDDATRAVAGRAWEPYPHATRALNLGVLLALVGDQLPAEQRDRLVGALAGYAAVAEQGLERHLEGNHLWRDIAAWVVATHLLGGSEWEEGRRRALAWWERVRKSQLLADGGHEERSPLYHALALQDVALTLFALPEGEVRQHVHADAVRMLPAWQALVRPDGRVHHFNDSAPRDDFEPASLAALLSVLGLPTAAEDGAFELPETGYAGMRNFRGGERVIVDHGLPAPRHQPGHLHCDLLSFEYDRDGRPFIVNAGVAGYEGDPLRAYFRGTTSHNTVQVGAYDQSELWGVFRVARMATPGAHSAEVENDGGWRFRGAMSPYAPAGVVHHRTLAWCPGRLEVSDEITGGAGARARVFLQFAHDVELRPAGPLRFEAVRGTTRALVSWEGAEKVAIHRGETAPPLGWHTERFGEARPAPCLVAECTAGEGPRVMCTIESAPPR